MDDNRWAVFVPTRLHRRLKPHISPSGLYDPFKTIASFPCSSTFPPFTSILGLPTSPTQTRRNETKPPRTIYPPLPHMSPFPHTLPLIDHIPFLLVYTILKLPNPVSIPDPENPQLYPPCHAEHILYKSKRGMTEGWDGRGVLIVREKGEGGGVSTWKILIGG